MLLIEVLGQDLPTVLDDDVFPSHTNDREISPVNHPDCLTDRNFHESNSIKISIGCKLLVEFETFQMKKEFF